MFRVFSPRMIYLNRTWMGETIKTAREALNLTLAELGQRCGLSPSFISSLERGKRDVSLENYLSLCVALALPPGGLLIDNLLVDRKMIFDAAMAELKAGTSRDAKLVEPGMRIAADYAAGFAVVICFEFIRQGKELSMAMGQPTELISQAVRGYLMIAETTLTLAKRAAILESLRTRPVATLTSLGLWTDALIADYLKHTVETVKTQGEAQPWALMPQRSVHSSITQRATLSDFDPVAMGRVLEDMTDIVHSAGLEAANQHLAPRNRNAYKETIVDNAAATVYTSSTDMKTRWKDYQKKLKQLCAVRGTKAAIAKKLKVSRTMVSKWVDAKNPSEPSADFAFQLIEWIDAHWKASPET